MSQYEATIYVIGPDDTLLEVNEAFWQFGEENGLCGKPETIVGRPLWDFVGTPGLKSLYRHILGIVRSKMKPFCFPLRCDSHQFQRFMTMTIAPRSDGSVRFIVELDRQVRLHAAARPISAANRRRLCRSCHKVEHEGEWVPLDEALTAQFFDVGADTIFLDVCDECERRSQPEALNRPYVN